MSGILKCAKEGKLFSAQDGICDIPLSQGHCDQGEMVVMGRRGMGICVIKKCKEDQVFREGKCMNMFKGN